MAPDGDDAGVEHRDLGVLEDGDVCWYCGESGIDRDHQCSQMEDFVQRKPLPPEHELDDAQCHVCGEPWDEDKWGERHHTTPDTIGESWFFTCPNCENEVFEVGT